MAPSARLIGFWRRHGRTVLAVAPLVVLLGAFFVVPILRVVWESFSGLALDLTSYRRLFTEAIYFGVLAHTLAVSLYVTLASLLLGYPLAYLLTTLSPRSLTAVSTLILVPLFTAFLIRTYAWMVILGREGIVNTALQWLGLADEPIRLLNTTLAVVIGMVHVMLPIAVFTMAAVMAQIDRSLVRAARVLGADPVRAFTRVYLPLSLPGVAAAGVLVFIMSLGFYITPALLGGPADTMISQLIVVQTTTLLNFQLGYASAVVLLLATLGILSVAGLFVPLEMMWTGHGARVPPRAGGGRGGADLLRHHLGRATRPLLVAVERCASALVAPLLTERRFALRAYAAALLAFLIAPLAVVVVLSFSASPFLVFPPPGFSWQWYVKLYHARDWHTALLFSLQIGLAAVAIALLAGAAGAFALVRSGIGAKRALFLLAISPTVIPVIVLALALYVYEARLGLLGTFPGLVIGHAVLATPFAVVVMASALRGLDPTLEDAAAVHGARPLRVLRRITLPLLRPALATAGLLTFLVSFDELLVSIFLLGRQPQTLPIKFWNDIRYQFDPLLSAASTLIVLAVAVGIVAVQVLRLRRLAATAGPPGWADAGPRGGGSDAAVGAAG